MPEQVECQETCQAVVVQQAMAGKRVEKTYSVDKVGILPQQFTMVSRDRLLGDGRAYKSKQVHRWKHCQPGTYQDSRPMPVCAAANQSIPCTHGCTGHRREDTMLLVALRPGIAAMLLACCLQSKGY